MAPLAVGRAVQQGRATRAAQRHVSSGALAPPRGSWTPAPRHQLEQQQERRWVARRAEEGEQQRSEGGNSEPATSGDKARRERPADPSVAKGQRTAIITGAISILFGVIYLGLVQVLDFRGGELLPPPPEAYEQY